MNITTGNEGFEIIATGSVISFKDENINFDIAPGFKVVVNFVTDESQDEKETQIQYNGTEGSGLEITFINADNALNRGTTEPVLIGFMNGRNVYLNLAIDGYGKGLQKLLHFTFYQRETMENQ
ncbi:DUF6864 domain-containing function [Chryseobacterium gregarium]|uniref:DUF6864 domain-containing function n=1 Tax=Chryseobacterium gregarium TaxID=456299 RepID=UPI0004816445|nr:hypothetical protein [Chryseobacterium gregarium]